MTWFDRDHSRMEFLRACVFLFFLFSAIFYGAELITPLRDDRFQLYFVWERGIPFYPAAYVLYYSVVLMPFLISVFALNVSEIRLWKRRMSVAIAVAGVVFLLFPADLGYPPAESESWAFVGKLTTILTGRHNLVPSLHVALMFIILRSLWPHLARRAKALMLAWGVTLPLSTLFTHQHHVLDVATGVLLGFLVCARVGLK